MLEGGITRSIWGMILVYMGVKKLLRKPNFSLSFVPQCLFFKSLIDTASVANL